MGWRRKGITKGAGGEGRREDLKEEVVEEGWELRWDLKEDVAMREKK